MAKSRRTIPGSEKEPLPKSKVIGKPDPQQRIEVTVLLRRRAAVRPPRGRQYVSREELAAQSGADPADMAKVEAFAQEHNLTVVEASLPERSIKLSGTVGDFAEAFGVDLKKSRLGRRVVRTRAGGISVPAELHDIVVGVFGLDDRPAARPHHRSRRVARSPRKKRAASPAAASGSFTPPQVAKLYNFPAGLDGGGQSIAIIELNDFDTQGKITGTGYSLSDLKAYFKSLGLPAPAVTAVGVDGGTNMPGPDADSDTEVMLDIEVAGAVAPKSSIAVYFAPNTDRGFLDAVNAAVHDDARKPSVISISWGAAEEASTQQSLNAFNQVLQDAAALGVTVCASSGDNGSSDMPQGGGDGSPHVDFPASSPFALGCGGTSLRGSGTNIASEVVWNQGNAATGGGVSNFFARPAYQSKAKVPKSPKGKIGRGVPDIAGDADPNTGYQIRLVGGKKAVIGGTSAVSPLWAGLVALINQRLAKLKKPPAGFLNTALYQSSSVAAFHDITQGNNDIASLGKYKAGPGWDPCTGLGTPDGAKLLKALGG